MSRIGTIERLGIMPSAHVQPRDVQVWLPPGYDAQSDQRYPVLYLHDGQNVFDAQAAGTEWQVDEAAQRGVASGRLRPFIVVAVASTASRTLDYTPTEHDRRRLNASARPRRNAKAAAWPPTRGFSSRS